MSRNIGISSSEINEIALSVTGTGISNLSKQQASSLIDRLTKMENEQNTRKAS